MLRITQNQAIKRPTPRTLSCLNSIWLQEIPSGGAVTRLGASFFFSRGGGDVSHAIILAKMVDLEDARVPNRN